MVTFCGANTGHYRTSRPLLHLATGSAEGNRCNRLALAAIYASPDRAIHSGKGDKSAACVADRYIYLDVEFLGLCQRGRNHRLGLFKCDAHLRLLVDATGSVKRITGRRAAQHNVERQLGPAEPEVYERRVNRRPGP